MVWSSTRLLKSLTVQNSRKVSAIIYTGTIQPIKEISDICREARACLCVGEVKIKKVSKTAYDEYGSPLAISDSHYNINARKLKLADVELDELEYIIEELTHELQTRTRRENELHEE